MVEGGPNAASSSSNLQTRQQNLDSSFIDAYDAAGLPKLWDATPVPVIYPPVICYIAIWVKTKRSPGEHQNSWDLW